MPGMKPGMTKKTRSGGYLETNAEAQVLLPHQAAIFARAAMNDHETPGKLGGLDEFEAGAAAGNIDDLATDAGRPRIKDQEGSLGDPPARPDAQTPAILYFAMFHHGAASKALLSRAP